MCLVQMFLQFSLLHVLLLRLRSSTCDSSCFYAIRSGSLWPLFLGLICPCLSTPVFTSYSFFSFSFRSCSSCSLFVQALFFFSYSLAPSEKASPVNPAPPVFSSLEPARSSGPKSSFSPAPTGPSPLSPALPSPAPFASAPPGPAPLAPAPSTPSPPPQDTDVSATSLGNLSQSSWSTELGYGPVYGLAEESKTGSWAEETGTLARDTGSLAEGTGSQGRETGSLAEETGSHPRETCLAEETGSLCEKTSSQAREIGSLAEETCSLAREMDCEHAFVDNLDAKAV